MTTLKTKLLSALTGLTLITGTIGCSSNAGTGALIGGASGAGLGAIIGHNSHDRTGSGALIGGAVGAVAGGLIGNEMDKDDRRARRYDDRYYNDRPAPRYYDDRDPHYRRPAPPPPDGSYESRHYEDSNGRYYDSYSETRRY